MNNKEIIHVTFQKEYRGGERQLVFLHEGLLKRGIQSSVIALKNSELQKNISGGFHGVRGSLDFLGKMIAKRLAGRDFILHAHDSRAFSACFGVKMLTGAPIVFSKKTSFPVRKSHFNRLKYAKSAAITAISRFSTASVAQVFPPEKVVIIPDGVLSTPLRYDRRSAREKLGIDQNVLVAGTVGYFTSEKNGPLVIELADRLAQEKPHAVVVCIGKLNDMMEKEISIRKNIIAPGIVADAREYYYAFDLYFSTATIEGLGSALLDAVVAGIPAIAINSGGCTDIFGDSSEFVFEIDNKNGFISKIINMLSDISHYSSRALAQKEKYSLQFSINQLVNSFIKIYDKIP